ncbi:energy transducer TonB [Paracoccus sp. PAR01]|uniref:energy transducer TonB family protein n=1 Tax=Paracoccus sp. PAR01 TaxID=2769282 RepID=UPI00177D429C|nr:energy transducer TonB [Paracoccus sp. PAR01]MBD9525658.1 TonB family protein [Paracoccus sp. PAR01]
MLRTVLSSLCVVLALSTPCLAEQAGGSGLPPPATQAQWKKAVKLRLSANGIHRLMAQGMLEPGIKGQSATIAFQINPDGRITNVKIVNASEGLSPRMQKHLVKAFEAMPKMPPFSPDMGSMPDLVTVPVNFD